MKELNTVLHLNIDEPKFYCQVFEDNRSTITVANGKKFIPRTKHIALKYHHFRPHVHSGQIKIEAIYTREQIADIFTKALETSSFQYLREKLLVW